MALRPNIWNVVYVLMMVLNSSPWVCGEQQVPCYFVFGASLVDNGNNNALNTLAKVNYRPYGIDFPGGPTGRFSNGRNMADIIAEHLGFKNYIPSFVTARGKQDILKGVNYASGGAGILDESGRNLGAVISMDLQLQNHQTTVSSIVGLLGDNQEALKHLSQCMYSVEMGNNDYYNNYLMPQFYNTSRQYTPEQYAVLLIQNYSQQLRTLYNHGARKVALFGIPPIGCTPAEVAKYGTNGSSCVDFINDAVQHFNSRLKSLIDDLNDNLKEAKFIYLNLFEIFSSSFHGFRVTNSTCCKTRAGFGLVTCLPFSIPCGTRSEYVWWDAMHPTEAANVIFAGRSYNAQSPSDTYPMDIRSLAQL